jgi:hypothetical protein
MSQEFWKEIDLVVNANREFILTEEEVKRMAKKEQENYEINLESIEEVLEGIRSELELRGFWVEEKISAKGLRFSFSLRGYYGPGGVSSQFHIAGPLVLGVIDPKGDESHSFYHNDIDECQQLGAYYDKNKFTLYIQKVIRDYLSPDNLIISREQYYRFRDLYSGK